MIGAMLLAATCDASLWAHVYKPERFKIIKPCVTVTAVLIAKRAEADGDYHLQLRLTTGDRWMLNEKNRDRQGDNLVAEVICAHKVTQKDAIATSLG